MNHLDFKEVKRLKEEQSHSEHVDEEVGMVLGNLSALLHNAREVIEYIESGELDITNGIEAWVVEKISLAHEDMETIRSYLMYSDSDQD
jgi:hypothetical protein